MIGIIIGAIIGIAVVVSLSIFEPHFDLIQDVDLNKVLIVWYNKYTSEGITREHKILYDTGRNKKCHLKTKCKKHFS